MRRLDSLDDSRLAARVAAGDEAAFAVLYDRHAPALLSFCRHMLGSAHDGEDALQQTFVRAHGALVGGTVPDGLRPWLFTIARNRCRSMLAARRELAVPVEEASFDGLADDVERRADLRELVSDLARLPEDQRGALVLFELGGLSQAEIGTALGVPADKVKALVFQARTELMAERDARNAPCESIRAELSVARGGALRRGPLRRHLRACEPCRMFGSAVATQRSGLAIILPVAPILGLKGSILAAAGGSGAAAAGSAAAGGAAGAAGSGAAGATSAAGAAGAAVTTGLGGGALAGVVAKVAISAALVGGGAVGGAAAVDRAPEPAGVKVAATVTSSPTATPSPEPTVTTELIAATLPPEVAEATPTPTPTATPSPTATSTAAPTAAPIATPAAKQPRRPRWRARVARTQRRAAIRRAKRRRAVSGQVVSGTVVEVAPTATGTATPTPTAPARPRNRPGPRRTPPPTATPSPAADVEATPTATPTRPHRRPRHRPPAATPPPAPTPTATPTP